MFNCNQNSSLYSSNGSREPFRTITLTLLRIYPIVFLLIGTFGNLLSVYVVLRSKLRRNSTFIYLAFLSIVDLIVLYTFCVNFILHAWFDIDLQQVSLVACKIYSFSIYFFPQMSAWILTAVSLDRVFALTRGVRKTRKIRFTYAVLLVIFIILFLLNVQFLFYDNSSISFSTNFNQSSTNKLYRIVDTDNDINLIRCSSQYSERYKLFYENIWVHVDATVNVYLPLFLMFLCSTIIFLSVLRTMRNANNTNKRLIARNLSTMLLSINAMFALLTGPIVVYLIFEKKTLDSIDYQCQIQVRAKHKMIKLICIILMNANHTGNILVYCLTGTEFRTQLLDVIGKRQRMIENSSIRAQTITLNKESNSPTSRTSSRKQFYSTTPRTRLRTIEPKFDEDSRRNSRSPITEQRKNMKLTPTTTHRQQRQSSINFDYLLH